MKPILSSVALAAVALSLTGCAIHGPSAEDIAVEQLATYQPRHSAPIFHGENGARMSWDHMLNALADADVIVLGELHDDAFGHRVQLAIVEDMMTRHEGTALSMEMLDRNEQATIDDYLAGMITQDQFIERTASTAWHRNTQAFLSGEMPKDEFVEKMNAFGWPDWMNNYLPIINAAKENNARIIGANTPWALYTRLANREGYDALNALTDAQRVNFDLPHEILTGTYRENFWQVMAGRAEGDPVEDVETPHGVHPGMTDESILGMFKSQLLMDATMAGSIANALNTGSVRVIHLVGQFHSDFRGGTVQELQYRKPGAKIMTVSLRRWDPATQDEGRFTLQPDDEDRADFVIYTQPAQ
ncbi:MAG: ChaN family lipoprotein [Phycisphaeraceae bacterium]|nr:ChaN family lipoprotein [Phycisphaerales bacterium]MCB9861602.1 ChaN family lipoprotein [Phycisphaeraceae bacterium]